MGCFSSNHSAKTLATLIHTYLFHTRRFAALAPQLVRQYPRRLTAALTGGVFRRRRRTRRIPPRVHEFGVKGQRIAAQNVAHGVLAQRLVGRRVGAVVAAAVGPAVEFDAKTLAVQFETARLFAGAAHVFNFVPVVGRDLRGRLGHFAVVAVGSAVAAALLVGLLQCAGFGRRSGQELFPGRGGCALLVEQHGVSGQRRTVVIEGPLRLLRRCHWLSRCGWCSPPAVSNRIRRRHLSGRNRQVLSREEMRCDGDRSPAVKLRRHDGMLLLLLRRRRVMLLLLRRRLRWLLLLLLFPARLSATSTTLAPILDGVRMIGGSGGHLHGRMVWSVLDRIITRRWLLHVLLLLGWGRLLLLLNLLLLLMIGRKNVGRHRVARGRILVLELLLLYRRLRRRRWCRTCRRTRRPGTIRRCLVWSRAGCRWLLLLLWRRWVRHHSISVIPVRRRRRILLHGQGRSSWGLEESLLLVSSCCGAIVRNRRRRRRRMGRYQDWLVGMVHGGRCSCWLKIIGWIRCWGGSSFVGSRGSRRRRSRLVRIVLFSSSRSRSRRSRSSSRRWVFLCRGWYPGTIAPALLFATSIHSLLVVSSGITRGINNKKESILQQQDPTLQSLSPCVPVLLACSVRSFKKAIEA